MSGNVDKPCETCDVYKSDSLHAPDICKLCESSGVWNGYIDAGVVKAQQKVFNDIVKKRFDETTPLPCP